MTKIITFLICMIIIPAFCHSEEPIGFKGINLGDDLGKIQNDKRFFCYEADMKSLSDIACGLKKGVTETIAKVEVNSMLLLFWNGKLQGIAIRFNSNGFNMVFPSMIQKYGKGETSYNEVQNRMGSKFKNQTTIWQQETTIIKASKFSNDLSLSEINYFTNDALLNFYQRRAIDIKRRSTDL